MDQPRSASLTEGKREIQITAVTRAAVDFMAVLAAFSIISAVRG